MQKIYTEQQNEQPGSKQGSLIQKYKSELYLLAFIIFLCGVYQLIFYLVRPYALDGERYAILIDKAKECEAQANSKLFAIPACDIRIGEVITKGYFPPVTDSRLITLGNYTVTPPPLPTLTRKRA